MIPTVAEVGGHLRVSAEVVDPRTQTTVYAAYADGKGADSALASVDDVTEELRQKLGEALESVQKDSKPLPQVSTSNLDALKAYALGQEAYGNDRFSDALQLYQQATTLDPKFALAWVGQARSLFSMLRTTESDGALAQGAAVAGTACHRARPCTSTAGPRNSKRRTGRWRNGNC